MTRIEELRQIIRLQEQAGTLAEADFEESLKTGLTKAGLLKAWGLFKKRVRRATTQTDKAKREIEEIEDKARRKAV